MSSYVMSFDSTPGNGGSQLSSDGSTFYVDLPSGILVPKNATSATMMVTNAKVYNNINNISSSKQNNKVYVTAPKEGGGTQPYTLTIPDGLYSLTDLDTQLKNLMDNLTIDTSTKHPFELTFNNTNRAIVKFNTTQCSIDMTDNVARPNNLLRNLLGFNAQVLTIPGGAIAPYSFDGDNKANFNVIEYFLITSNICQNGMSVNGKDLNILAQLYINAQPGYPIMYEPYHPTRLNANHLRGWDGSKRFMFSLKDHLNRTVDTSSETWSFKLQIDYTM